MINHADLMAALTTDYLNVFVARPKQDSADIIKLKGYVTTGINDTPQGFQYSKLLSTYANERIYEEDKKPRTYKVGSTVVAYMIFGYDKDWIFEDYVWTKATQCYSTAMVYRNGYDTGWNYCTGSEAGKNSYSTIEVTHQTYLVYYKMQLSASYSNVTYTTAASSVKYCILRKERGVYCSSLFLEGIDYENC